jgi:hypothetical protein
MNYYFFQLNGKFRRKNQTLLGQESAGSIPNPYVYKLTSNWQIRNISDYL